MLSFPVMTICVCDFWYIYNITQRLQVAHVVPKVAQDPLNEIWKSLEMFVGKNLSSRAWEIVAGPLNINSLVNNASLSNHNMGDKGTFQIRHISWV